MHPLHRPPAQPPAPDDLFVRLQAALAGEYSIERELGRGGMGIVYLAREVRLAREVAIKVLPPALASSPELRAQFLREAQMAARLSHPNIVPIHRVDETQGFVYFVMAFIAGETLAERIATRGPLPPHQAVRILREVAWALTYAHGSGIVHRDVKADNILLERSGERVLVTDFGIANVAHADARTSDGHVTGSPHYASPEQIAGEPVEASSDIYSLGVVGFLALTGRLPFDAPEVRDVVAMHLTARPPSITSLAPTVPPRLAQLVERCLAKRPQDRPLDARAFADMLGGAIEPPHEIPAPLRVWLARTNQHGVAMPLLGAYLGAAITITGFAAHVMPLAIPAALLCGVGLAIIPTLVRTQRVLSAGYSIDDLRLAIREYWMRRREENAYELSRPTGRVTAKAIGVFYVSAISTTLLQAIGAISRAGWLAPLTGLAATIAVTTGVLSLGRFIRLKVNPQLGARQIRFYDSKWGERFVKLAGLGLKKRTPAQSLSQLTEVALGRATDALYDALPKPVKKQLKELPGTVRRLEDDAKALRAEMEKLDASLIALDTDAASAMPSAINASRHEAPIRVERDRLRTDLRSTRDRTSDRLAATVAALENIRLDLLRLQLGDARVESVTASLDAARDVIADLAAYADATIEIERSLGVSRRSPLPGGLPRAPHVSIP